MRGFWIVSILLFIWALLGDMAYLSQSNLDLDDLAKTDPVGAEAFRAMPGWVWAVYAIAVSTSTLGALALLFRRTWAVPLFAVSLMAVVLQFGWTLLSTPLVSAKGASVAIMPLAIIAIGAFALWWAIRHVRMGTLR